MARGTTLRNVRLDDARWESLAVVAAERGVTRSDLIRGMVDALIEADSDLES